MATAIRSATNDILQRDTFARSNRSLRVAYIMSRFPKITETFVLFEMLSAEQQGARVEVYPIWRERTKVMHDEARDYVQRAHFMHLLSWLVLAANMKWLCRRPRRYLGALWTGLCANFGSRRYFIGFIATFPKAVAMGDDMLRRGVQHVHAHFASHPAAAAYVIHRLFNLPFSFTAHGSDLHRDVHMLREKVREASLVVAVSEYNREAIIAECGEASRHRIAVIHCGTDTRVFSRNSSWTPAATVKPQLTCVGTLHEVKGQRQLVEACALLQARGVDFQLNLVGDGPDLSRLKDSVAKHHLQQAVHFHGRRTRNEVVDILSHTDIVIAPSVPSSDGRREGIPVALMEAMSCGAAVVASRLSGIPELVEHEANGLLVTPGDVPGIAAAIEQLIRNPDQRASVAQAARETIEERFDLDRNARQLLAHFWHAAERSKGNASVAIAAERISC